MSLPPVVFPSTGRRSTTCTSCQEYPQLKAVIDGKASY